MKRLILIAAALMACVAGFAQNDLKQILSKAETSRVSVAYDCTIMQQDVPMKFKGVALLQGNCFTLKGNGMEIYCDGKTLVYVDPASKEAYYEDASGLEEYIRSNAGAVREMKLSDVRYEELSDDLSDFRFNTLDLDSRWVITDLR